MDTRRSTWLAWHSHLHRTEVEQPVLEPCRPPKPGAAAGLAQRASEEGSRGEPTQGALKEREGCAHLGLEACRNTATYPSTCRIVRGRPSAQEMQTKTERQPSPTFLLYPPNFKANSKECTSLFRQAAISEEFALSSDAPWQLKSLQSWSQHVYKSTATLHCPLP